MHVALGVTVGQQVDLLVNIDQAGRLVTHSLVINSKWLSKQGVYAQGFADDGVAVVIGYFLTTLCEICLLYTSPSPRDRQKSRMPSSA